jgi:folate-binding protein YgfZ
MSAAELYTRIRAQGGAAHLVRVIFRLTGGDRVRYLNGQVSNDVRKLIPQESIHACVMTSKGKMCADIFVAAGPDYLLADAEPSLQESLAVRLERYVISDDVTIEDVTGEYELIHLMGVPPSFFSGNGPSMEKRRSRRYGRNGWDIFVKREDFGAVWSWLAEHLPVIDGEMLETLRIEAGVPRWGFELGEDTIPVEAGLEKTAIDYNKGCYIGQEIISRLKSIGHVNRQLHGFVSQDAPPLIPGMRLHIPGNSGREAGWLTSACHSFALEKPVALGYLKRGITPGELTARSVSEASSDNVCSVMVKELPFIP